MMRSDSEKPLNLDSNLRDYLCCIILSLCSICICNIIKFCFKSVNIFGSDVLPFTQEMGYIT